MIQSIYFIHRFLLYNKIHNKSVDRTHCHASLRTVIPKRGGNLACRQAGLLHPSRGISPCPHYLALRHPERFGLGINWSAEESRDLTLSAWFIFCESVTMPCRGGYYPPLRDLPIMSLFNNNYNLWNTKEKIYLRSFICFIHDSLQNIYEKGM